MFQIFEEADREARLGRVLGYFAWMHVADILALQTRIDNDDSEKCLQQDLDAAFGRRVHLILGWLA